MNEYRTLIFGFGYLGRRVARLAVKSGDTVFATTRSSEKLDSIQSCGATPLLCDWTDRRTLAKLPTVDRVLVAVAFDRTGSVDRDTAMVGGLGHLIDALNLAGKPDQSNLCYISTTGVYHQAGGVWVDETSTTQPTRDGGKAHLRAESLLYRRLGNQGYRILRLSGIYGPDRVPRAADVIAGRPIASPAKGYLNLIHVEDAANAVMSAWQLKDSQAGNKRHIYVISDDQPVVRSEFYRQIARQTFAPEPTFIDPAKDSSARFRSDSDKRVWNRRMKEDLHLTLKYPTYREGLADVLGGCR